MSWWYPDKNRVCQLFERSFGGVQATCKQLGISVHTYKRLVLGRRVQERTLEKIVDRLQDVGIKIPINQLAALEGSHSGGLADTDWKFRIGLAAIHETPREEHISPFLAQTNNLTLILDDGEWFFALCHDALAACLAGPNMTVTFILLHPKSSFLDTLAQKHARTLTRQLDKLHHTFRSIQQLNRKYPNTDIRVLGHCLFHPYELCLTDSHALTIPHHFHGPFPGSLWVFSNDAVNPLFTAYKKDAHLLLQVSTELKESDFR